MPFSDLLQPLRQLARRLAAGVLRVVVIALAALAAVVALALGLAMAAGLLLWSLLRGRTPLPPNVFVRRARTAPRAPPAEVVDVQVREIEPAPAPEGQRTPPP